MLSDESLENSCIIVNYLSSLQFLSYARIIAPIDLTSNLFKLRNEIRNLNVIKEQS